MASGRTSMFLSAEIRWFWSGTPPNGLEEGFRGAGAHPCVAGGGTPRTDKYLFDGHQTELGIKRRGGRKGVEIKGLVAILPGTLSEAPFVGSVELWTKWSSETLQLDSHPLIGVEKQRWARKFEVRGQIAREVPLDEQ